jgi:type I restriction enzyme, R subunit
LVQNLRQAVENRLQLLLQQNPLRADFQQHYERIVAEYNREKDRVTIERTFEALFKLVQELSEEESRAFEKDSMKNLWLSSIC